MPADRKAAIVAAAAALFAERGFAGTTVDGIGTRAGVTGPALYRHFRGKDALLAAVVMDTVAAFAVPLDVPPDDLEAVVAAAVAVALDDPARLATYVRERHRLTGPTRAALAGAERQLYRPWRAAIQAAVPTLPDTAVASRQVAALTAMSVVASHPAALARPGLDRLLVDSTVAVLVAPPAPIVTRPASTPPWEPPAGRRDRIRVEALRLFRDKGYHGVGMDEIGRAAGVTGPTIYAHHASKGALLLDACERAEARFEAAAHHAVTGAASALDALDRLAAGCIQVALDDPVLVVVAGREVSAVAPADRCRLERRRGEVLDTWAAVVGALRPDLDEPAVRAVVGGVLPLVAQVAHGLGEPAPGVPLVRAWCLGRGVDG